MKLFSLFNGLKVGYREWLPKVTSSDLLLSTRISTNKILAMHGWLDNSNSFSFLGPYLADKGYHVVAFDHLGHGLSSHLGAAAAYSHQRSVGVARDIMEILGWEKSHVIGHSMGGSIGMLYSAVYSEMVERLVMIDGFGPLVQPAEKAPQILRRALDSERANRLKKSSIAPKVYPNVGTAIQARINFVSKLPGKQYISREAAAAIIARGVKRRDISLSLDAELDGGSDLIDENIGPISFRHDQRLLLPSLTYQSKEQVWGYINNLTCKSLLIGAADGWPFTEYAGDLTKQRKFLTDKGLLTDVILSGSHHLHLDPDHASHCAKVIEQFLSSSE